MNARSAARFFAMLAQGGALDGVRLLSEERVRWLSVPRPPCDYDYVQGVPHNGGIGGFHLVASIAHHRAYGSVPRRFDWVKLGRAMRPHPCRWSRRGGTRGPLAIPAQGDRLGGRIPIPGWRSP